MINKYYVYRHVRLDTNEVFYIGIGTKNENDIKNNFYTRAYSLYRNKHWKSIVDKTDYKVEILFESDDRKFIENKEIEFIALYGRKDLNKGTLVNLTDGGEGVNRNREKFKILIYILDLNLNIIKKVKGNIEASLFVYGTEKYHKNIALCSKFGFKTRKKYYIIKAKNWDKRFDILKITRKPTKSSRGNCKSFYYLNKFYKMKTDLMKELNLNRYNFDKEFKKLLKNNLIIWKKI